MEVLERPVTRAKSGFRWEAEMIEPLLAARSSFTTGIFSSPLVDARLEVPTASGVPDVVFVEWDQQAVDERARWDLSPVLDMTKLRALYRLNDGAATAEDLAAATHVSSAHVRRNVVPHLRELGWLEGSLTTGYSLMPGLSYQTPVRALVTVEAKLSDWRRAFTQAVGHVQSADRSFIALDARRASGGVSVAAELAGVGVGVATVDADTGNVLILSRPRPQKVRSVAYFLAAEQVLSLRLNGRESGDVGHVFGRDLAAARVSQA